MAHIPKKPQLDYQRDMEKNMAKTSMASRKPNEEILEHQVCGPALAISALHLGSGGRGGA